MCRAVFTFVFSTSALCSCSACFAGAVAVELHSCTRWRGLQVLQGVPGGRKGEGETFVVGYNF